MLDEQKRDDVAWLIARYDELVAAPPSPSSDADLRTLEAWLCRVTSRKSLSAALAAARQTLGHESTFVTPANTGPGTDQHGQKDESGGSEHNPAPRLTENTAFEAERLLAELDSLSTPRPPTSSEHQQVSALRRRILDVTGFPSISAVRAAVRSYMARLEATRKRPPTKKYAAEPRTHERIRVVYGGSPGSGRR